MSSAGSTGLPYAIQVAAQITGIHTNRSSGRQQACERQRCPIVGCHQSIGRPLQCPGRQGKLICDRRIVEIQGAGKKRLPAMPCAWTVLLVASAALAVKRKAARRTAPWPNLPWFISIPCEDGRSDGPDLVAGLRSAAVCPQYGNRRSAYFVGRLDGESLAWRRGRSRNTWRRRWSDILPQEMISSRVRRQPRQRPLLPSILHRSMQGDLTATASFRAEGGPRPSDAIAP